MTTRYVDTHKTNECNRQIEIVAGPRATGGASTIYVVTGPRFDVPNVGRVPRFQERIEFQNGPIADGVNGITHEVMLAIIEDRLMGFQSGPFACERNERTLQHIRAAQQELKARTDERIERGVEGTHNV